MPRKQRLGLGRVRLARLVHLIRLARHNLPGHHGLKLSARVARSRAGRFPLLIKTTWARSRER